MFDETSDNKNKEFVMKTKIFLVSLFIVLNISLSARVVPLPEVVRPTSLSVDDTQLYICEHEKISIYSIKDFKLIKKYGEKGEGPQEFKSATHVNELIFACNFFYSYIVGV